MDTVLKTRHYGGGPCRLDDPDTLAFACELLTTTRVPTDRVALEVGYRSFTAFSNSFFAKTGERPSDYRRNRLPREEHRSRTKPGRKLWTEAEIQAAKNRAKRARLKELEAAGLRPKRRRRRRS